MHILCFSHLLYHRGTESYLLISHFKVSVWGNIFCCYQESRQHNLVLFLFQSGAGGGMNINVTSMSRPGVGSMGGSYAGANDMANNGLSANQNQVR